MDRQSSSIVAAVLAVVAVSGVCALRIKKARKEKDILSTLYTLPFELSTTQLIKLIQHRRSIFPKQYTGNKVSRESILEMLEAARWAPTHHLTEPWEFVVFESLEERMKLGDFLAESYRESCAKSDKPFLQTKYDKKKTNTAKASHVIGIVVVDHKRNPLVEEIASVSMAVQNMSLVATAHGVGSYWSSGGIYEGKQDTNHLIRNPKRLKEFLGWSPEEENKLCLGWFFVGDYYGGEEDALGKNWPSGRRKPLEEGGRLTWR